MTQRDDLDRLLSAWLDDPYTPPAPHYLGRVLERTRQTRQRPAWASLERWLPMTDKVLQPATTPQLRMARLLLIALLVLALAGAVAFVGSRLIAPTPVIPQGGSAVLAFSSIVAGSSGQTGGDIFIVRADGTDLRRLTTGIGIRSDPIWSPDGTRIAYRDTRLGAESIVVMDAGGRNATTLATTDSSAAYCAIGGMAWSPDGTSLVFPTSQACDGRSELFIVAADGSSPATGLLAPGADSAYPAWSPDGKQIAFLGSETLGSNGVYVADVGSPPALSGGLAARRIGAGAGEGKPGGWVNAAAGSLAEALSGPQWSPDGTELAVINSTFGATTGSSGIVIMKADGSGQRVIAEDVGNPLWSPIWSPNGRQLAYARAVDPAEYFNQRPCTVRFWVIDADGTDERRLDPLGDGCDMRPSWSPDGSRLLALLIGEDASFHVSMIPIDGSEPIVTPADGGAGSWQPIVAPIPPAPSFEAPAATP